MKGHESRVLRRHHRHKLSELKKKKRLKNGYSLWILEVLPLHMLCVEIWRIYYSVPENLPLLRVVDLFKSHESQSHRGTGPTGLTGVQWD